jgi:hypothetical protein
VILRRWQQSHLATVGHPKHREFLADEELLDHHRVTGRPETMLAKHRAHRFTRLGAGLAHDRTLAGGQARCLDHQRFGMIRDVLEGRVEIGEGGASGSGYTCRVHHFLRERLGCLDLRRCCPRAEYHAALAAEPVGKSQRQWQFGTDHHEVDCEGIGQVGDPIDVVGRDLVQLCQLCDSGVAGRSVEFVCRVVGGECRDDCVLAATAANDQDPHDAVEPEPRRRASSNAVRALSAAFLAALRMWVATSFISCL